jgi:hypothetical protein
MAEDTEPTQEAERLRLQGNDAFSTRDWERAVLLYQTSVEHTESAKAYSNLVRTLRSPAQPESSRGLICNAPSLFPCRDT